MSGYGAASVGARLTDTFFTAGNLLDTNDVVKRVRECFGASAQLRLPGPHSAAAATVTDFPLVTAANSVCVLVSFEGPDPYSQAGGLGVRMTGLAHTLAQQGYETHIFFVGDPSLPGEERLLDGRLILHRWCQWISRYYPAGVYDGEEAKLSDFTRSLTPYLLDNILLPTISAGRTPIVMLE